MKRGTSLASARLRRTVQQHVLSEDIIIRIMRFVFEMPCIGMQDYENLDFVLQIMQLIRRCKQVCVWWCIAGRECSRNIADQIVFWAREPGLIPWITYQGVSRISMSKFLVSLLQTFHGSPHRQHYALKILQRIVRKKPHIYSRNEFLHISTEISQWVIQNASDDSGTVLALKTLVHLSQNPDHASNICSEAFCRKLVCLIEDLVSFADSVSMCCEIFLEMLSCAAFEVKKDLTRFLCREQNIAVFTNTVVLVSSQVANKYRCHTQTRVIDVLSHIVKHKNDLTSDSLCAAYQAIVNIMSGANTDENLDLSSFAFISSILEKLKYPCLNSTFITRCFPCILQTICARAENFSRRSANKHYRLPYLCSKIIHFALHQTAGAFREHSLTLQTWLLRTVLFIICGEFASKFGEQITKKNSFCSLVLLSKHCDENVFLPNKDKVVAVLNAHLDWSRENNGWEVIKNLPWHMPYILNEALDMVSGLQRLPALIHSFISRGGHLLLLRILQDEKVYPFNNTTCMKALKAIESVCIEDADYSATVIPRVYSEDLRSCITSFTNRKQWELVTASHRLSRALPTKPSFLGAWV